MFGQQLLGLESGLLSRCDVVADFAFALVKRGNQRLPCETSQHKYENDEGHTRPEGQVLLECEGDAFLMRFRSCDLAHGLLATSELPALGVFELFLVGRVLRALGCLCARCLRDGQHQQAEQSTQAQIGDQHAHR